MLNLAGKSQGKFATSLKPWINVMTDLAAKLCITAALFTGLSNPTAFAQSRTPFATGVTEPLGGLVLSGTAINPSTGNPYRHLWNSDQAGFGLCRLDPDIDTPGPHAININTCLPFVGGTAFKPGQLAFDPSLNNIYAVNLQSNSNGVYRLHFVPGADGGHGNLDLLHQEILGGDVSGCAIPGSIPNSAVLGPDGNLYIGFKRSGNIVRINTPEANPISCSNVQLIGSTADQAKNFGLGWIGHDLFGGDGLSLWIMNNADQCMTPANGLFTCRARSIFTLQTSLPTFVMTDQIYPATTGNNIYVANAASLTLVNITTLQVTQNYATSFEFLGGLAIDPKDFSIFAADDPAAGKLPAQGRWFDLGNGPSNGGRPPGTLTEFAAGVTFPVGGLILPGTEINPATGAPYRHFWTSDSGGFGLCRLDPDVDTPGPHTINGASCLPFVAGVQFKPGELAYDPVLNDIYAVDMQANTQGIFRLHYMPSGGGGHGAIDPLHTEVLGGSATPVQQTVPAACGIPGNIPNSAVLGPDGALYVGFKASGNILRINSPQTEPLPCTNLQIIGTTPDNKKDFGLGFIGHDLFGGDGLSAWIMVGADLCLKPGAGSQSCQSTSILVPQTASPTYVMTDQLYPAMNGRNLFVGQPGNITLVDTVNLKVTLDYASGFQFLTGMALDPANQSLYAADDPTDGRIGGQGHWWLVGQPQQPGLVVPGAPANVTATGGDGQASVNWTPAADGQPVTSFTVHNSFAANNAPVADVLVTPAAGSVTVPSTAVVSGLSNGISYQFTVAATNSVGTSAFSAPSNAVTPKAITVPDAPINVTAQPGNGSASISWSAPAVNGGAAITSYTVTAVVSGAQTGLTVKAAAPTTATVFAGLTNGTTYAFVVQATNSAGNSANSAPSNAVTPSAPAPAAPPAVADVAVTINGPTTVPSGSTAGYEITITNRGSSSVPQVIVTDAFAATAAQVLSATPSQGTCTISGTVTCNLGSLSAGGTAAIGITETVTGNVTNSASLQPLDAGGNAMAIAVPGSGNASITTTVATPPPAPTPTPTPTPTPAPAPQTVTDLALTGQYVPAGGQGMITWQIQNLGAADAANVVFAAAIPATINVNSLQASLGGSCTESSPFPNQIRVICSLPLLGSGQTWSASLVAAAPIGNAVLKARVRFRGTDPVLANNFYALSIAESAQNGSGNGGSGPTKPLPPVREPNPPIATRVPLVGSRTVRQ